MATVKENLIAAKALIANPKKWLKGAYSDAEYECFCMVGALLEGSWHQNSETTVKAIEAQIPSGFVPAPKDRELRLAAAFNDHSETTHADVMALFDRAIAAQDDQP